MYFPTTRVLTVLELLQSHQRLSGPDIAERLEVNTRTVRRYITMLQDLGIPVEAERGRYGTYRLRPGFKLPPLTLHFLQKYQSFQPLKPYCESPGSTGTSLMECTPMRPTLPFR